MNRTARRREIQGSDLLIRHERISFRSLKPSQHYHVYAYLIQYSAIGCPCDYVLFWIFIFLLQVMWRGVWELLNW